MEETKEPRPDGFIKSRKEGGRGGGLILALGLNVCQFGLPVKCRRKVVRGGRSDVPLLFCFGNVGGHY